MFSILWFLFGLLSVLLPGLLILAVLGQAQSWIGPRTKALAKAGPTVEPWVPPAFKPMEFPELPMKWPSESAWALPRRADPPWPSELWDDSHFGKGRKRFVAPPSDGGVVGEAEGAFFQSPTRAAKAGGAESAAPKQPAQPKAPPKAQKAEAQKQAPAKQVAPAQKPAAPQKQAAPAQKQAAPAPAAKPAAQAGGGQPPSYQEIEAWMKTQGLAGAIQQIMQRTGWDFRKAAAYLSEVRKNHG